MSNFFDHEGREGWGGRIHSKMNVTWSRKQAKHRSGDLGGWRKGFIHTAGMVVSWWTGIAVELSAALALWGQLKPRADTVTSAKHSQLLYVPSAGSWNQTYCPKHSLACITRVSAGRFCRNRYTGTELRLSKPKSPFTSNPSHTNMHQRNSWLWNQNSSLVKGIFQGLNHL